MRLTLAKDLAPLKTDALRRIDAAAEQARAAWITPGSGQALVYQAKGVEAGRYLAASPPPADLSSYPLLAAEIGLTAPNALELAYLWQDLNGQWTLAAASIERARLAAKRAVGEAQTPADIEAVALGSAPTP